MAKINHQCDDDRIGWRIDEFCRLVGVSRPTVWRLAKSGRLNMSYLGKIPIIPRSEAVRLGLIAA